MQALIRRYLNEIVSLTVMGLMCVALVAGQAGAAPGDIVDEVEPVVIEVSDERLQDFIEQHFRLVDQPEFEVGITFRFRHTGE